MKTQDGFTMLTDEQVREVGLDLPEPLLCEIEWWATEMAPEMAGYEGLDESEDSEVERISREHLLELMALLPRRSSQAEAMTIKQLSDALPWGSTRRAPYLAKEVSYELTDYVNHFLVKGFLRSWVTKDGEVSIFIPDPKDMLL